MITSEVMVEALKWPIWSKSCVKGESSSMSFASQDALVKGLPDTISNSLSLESIICTLKGSAIEI